MKMNYVIMGGVFLLVLVSFSTKMLQVRKELAYEGPTQVTLSGTYTCLPLLDPKAPPAQECVFGLKTDDGAYYMVNFGQSASAKEQFDKRAHITAKGFVVIKEALNTDQWVNYNMKGIFTLTEKTL